MHTKKKLMKKILTLVAFYTTLAAGAQTIDSVAYTIDGKPFKAFYAKPTKITSNTRTILIVHEWWGLNAYPKTRALKIAEEGNIAFCIDMYGDGKIADNPTDAQALAMPFYVDPALANERFMAGYNEAIKLEGVNKQRIAAIGYCFGGSMVLNAAKMGAPIVVAVSFHGGLAGIPVDKDKLTAAVLVCNGAADTFVPKEDIDMMEKQMKENNEDYTFINYVEALHAFTNPMSTEVGKKFEMPIAYNEAADLKSWKDFTNFLNEKMK